MTHIRQIQRQGLFNPKIVTTTLTASLQAWPLLQQKVDDRDIFPELCRSSAAAPAAGSAELLDQLDGDEESEQTTDEVAARFAIEAKKEQILSDIFYKRKEKRSMLSGVTCREHRFTRYHIMN